MFAIPKSDPLDVLLFGIGLRITQLAKMGDPKFKSLLDNRNFSIQMGSEEQGLYRTFSVENGRFNQTEGKTDKPTLTIDFKDSMTGAKLLTKGDATAFMMGVQNGDVKMTGDYSLLMWFNQIAKHIIPKIPEPLQPAVDMAKPFITKATPMAKDLCDKGMALLAGLGILGSSSAKAKNSKESENDKSSKDSAKDDSKDKSESKEEMADSKSLIDTAKEKLNEVKAEVEEKVGELKEKFDDVTAETKDKLAEVKSEAESKVAEVKEKAEDLTNQTKEKAEDLTTQAKEKLEEVKSDAQDKLDTAKEKAETVTTEVKDKAESLKSDTKEKLDDVKADVKDKTDDIKEKATDLKEQAVDKLESGKEKAEQATDSTQAKLDELKAKAQADDTEKLTPALQKSQELEAKHADEKIIAENVKTEAVKDDKSPVTNVTVTRATDTKSDNK